MTKFPDPMKEDEATAYLSEKSGIAIGPTALRGLRQRGRHGPAFFRMGDRKTRYWRKDLDKWLVEWMRKVRPGVRG